MPSLFFAISHGAIRKTFRGVSGRGEIPFRGGHNHVPNVIKYGSGHDEIPLGTVLNTLRNLIKYPTEPTIPLKSRSPDVGVSGLIIRQEGVDMLPIASSVKGRKVRIRAKVQLPNHYPVW